MGVYLYPHIVIVNTDMIKEKILNLPLIMHKRKMCVKWDSKISGIYAWVNEINGKMYIGQTINFYKRIYDEMNGFRNNKHQSMFKLFNAIQKYGIDNFRVVRLLECPKEYLNKTEILLIEYYDSKKNGYNCTIGGEGTGGHKVTQQQIEKQRVAMKQFWTDERCKLHSEKMKVWFNSKPKNEQDEIRSGHGWWLDKECKKKQIENYKLSLTPERIERRRNSLIRYYEGNDSKRAIKTEIISPTNEIVEINGTVKFCREYHFATKTLDDVLSGRKIHHKGWHINPEFIFVPPKLKQLASPDGKIYEFQSSLRFCREHKLDLGGIKNVIMGKSKHYKLWRLPETSLENARNNKNSIYKNVQFQFPDNHVESAIDRRQFCRKYGYSYYYLYKFLKNKSVGDMFYKLKLISK